MRLGLGHRSAIKTVRDGHRFPSKLEARVYSRLLIEARVDGATLYRQVRLPLLSLGPDDDLRPLYATIDFALRYPDGRIRLIDAKAKRWKSDEWLRGQRAIEGFYGVIVELADK
jgi:hypothetical protein